MGCVWIYGASSLYRITELRESLAGDNPCWLCQSFGYLSYGESGNRLSEETNRGQANLQNEETVGECCDERIKTK